MFIRELLARFRNLNISVNIDPQLLPDLDCTDRVSTSRIVTINLYKLIYAIGTIQTRRFAPSNRMKFIDKSDLIEKIYSNTNDFRIKLDEIRKNGGQEILASISEDFGVGISVVIAENLFNIEYSTIHRIYGPKKRPDWKCLTNTNRILVVESKGASSQNTSNNQAANALIQKTMETGDVKVASLTLLNENTISTNRFLDPPISLDNMDLELKKKVLRAGHYSSVFSFLGHSMLSKYYSQMRKRLLNSITPNEQNNKERLYFELRDIYPSILFDSKSFTGSFYHIDQEKFIFIGIDKMLLSYNGFLNFHDYDREKDEIINENYYILFKDGILIIEINQISEFSNIITPDKIQNYQEYITISDVDTMTEISFRKYVDYLLIQNGFRTEFEQYLKDFCADIIGWKNNKKYVFELKLFRKKKPSRIDIRAILRISQTEDIEKVILITNAIIPEQLTDNIEKLILIGRTQLRAILKNKKNLLDIIDE